jgi:hypothetical protein
MNTYLPWAACRSSCFIHPDTTPCDLAPLSQASIQQAYNSMVATSPQLARKEILKFSAASKTVNLAIQRLLHTSARALPVQSAFSSFFDDQGLLKIHSWYGFDASANPESCFLQTD